MINYTRKQDSKSSLTEQIVKSAKTPIEKEPPVEFISTGSIMLNLAASQKAINGGWARGRINNIIGDGSSGKTLLALEACFWAYKNITKVKSRIYPRVHTVKIIYNNVEWVMDFPIDEMYGQDFHDFVDWRQKGICQEAGRDIQREIDQLKKGEFLLYVLDSIDATISEEEKARIDKALKDDKSQDGSYQTEKAKYFSMSFFNDLCNRMKDKKNSQPKDATLILISQVREKIGITFGKKMYRTGGKALDFYTHQCAWLAEIKKLTKTFRSQTRAIGIRSKAKWERNKTAKPFREAEFSILFDYGLDDIGTMLDYLYGPEEKSVTWNDTEYKSKANLLAMIENDEDEYNALADRVREDWIAIENKIKPKRKAKVE